MAKLVNDVDTITQQVDGETHVNPDAETATEKKLSPKNKLTRGVSADTKTTWVPFDNTPEDNEMFRRVAAVRSAAAKAVDTNADGIKVGDFLAAILQTAIDHYRPQLEAEAATWTGKAPTKSKTAKKIDEMTPEELEKYGQSEEQKAQAKLNAAHALLAKARERAAAAKAAAGG